MASPVEQLEAMRSLPESWDGYGGAPPRAELIEAAIGFLDRLENAASLPEPFVTPTRVGGILIEWEQGSHQLEVDIDSPEQGTFVYLNRATGESATGSVILAQANGRSSLAVSAILSAIPADSVT